MSNNTNSKIEEKQSVIGFLRFISTSISVVSAIVVIASAISKARSTEPTYVYLYPTTMSMTPPVPAQSPQLETEPEKGSIIPVDLNYYYYDGTYFSTEQNNSTDQLIISAHFVNTGNQPETAELQILINDMITESNTVTLSPGDSGSIFTIISPDEGQDITALAIPAQLNRGLNRGVLYAN